MNMNIGKRIRELRQANNLKVVELAKKSHISQPYLSDIEKGRTTPSLDKLTSICEALNISLGEFFEQPSDLPSDLLQFLEAAKSLTKEERQAVIHMIKTLKG